MSSRRVLFLALCFLPGFSPLNAAGPVQEPRRLEVLFLGDDRGHKPIERYRVLKQALGPQGFNLTFVEDLAQMNRSNLDRYDALIVYANHEKDKVPQDILPWVRDGGALVALHSACGNFHPSKEWFDLVGGRFASHEGHVFSPRTVDKEHPITKDLPPLKSWDETYQHRDLTADRHLLQVRDPINKDETEPEPWTWTRNEGKGRVFYTASGHDLRCWNEEAYQILVKRGILWTIGEERAAMFSKYQLSPLEIEVPQVENRAHPEIPMMPLQKPLSPSHSAAHTQVPVGTQLVLFASEPMVVNPISIDWDERGRAWVVESFGYPNDVPVEPGSGDDRIKILEDTDGDGAADKMTIFAEGLRHCTTTVFSGNGVIATDGRDIVHLTDTNGDGKSDERKVLATGLNIHDTHASTSQFLYGLDNWIHATVGYSGVDMKISGKPVKFGSSVFRFTPDLSKLELLQATTNNTWGLGFTEEGDITGSTANNNPSWIMAIPASAYEGSGIEQPRTPRIDASTVIYPNTRDVTQVDQIDRFTAAAGHQFLTDTVMRDLFPARTAMICEPTGHIVASGRVDDQGALLRTDLRGNNLFASADAWSAPVAARVGPDGAVWVADWYNPIVQHNVVFRYYNAARGYDQPHSPYHIGAKGPGKGNAYETPLRDRKHGRIWRIVPKDKPIRTALALDHSKPQSLIAGLTSPSQLIRLHAQRLIAERGGSDLIPDLTALIKNSAAPEGIDTPLGAVHAIHALAAPGLIDHEESRGALTAALASSHPLIRRHAMLALGAGNAAVTAALPRLIEQSAEFPRELLMVLTTIAQGQPNQPIAAALWKLVSGPTQFDAVLQQAAQLAMRRQAVALLGSNLTSIPAEEPKLWFEKEIVEIIQRTAAGSMRPALIAIAASAPAGLKSHIEKALKATPSTPITPEALPAHLLAGHDAYMKACIECHQADGQGVPDTFPPLAGSEWVTGDRQRMLRILLGGLAGPIEVKGTQFNGVMPGHSHMKDEEIAAIASYVRHAFGDLKETPVTPAEVKALRPEIDKRKFMPWSPQELEAAGK